jgi:hypothetical protein
MGAIQALPKTNHMIMEAQRYLVPHYRIRLTI